MEQWEQLLDKFLTALENGFPALGGAIANLLYIAEKHKELPTILTIITHLIIALFVGNLVYDFIPEENQYKGSIVAVNGSVAWVVFGLIKMAVLKATTGKLQNILGVEISDDKPKD